MIKFIVSPSDLAALQKQPLEFRRRMEKGLEAGAKHVNEVGREKVNAIYARPIPRRKRTGKPMWRRKGVLRASQQLRRAPGQRTVAWAATYGQTRFGLGVDWMPKNPAEGVVRLNNVAQETADEAKTTLGAVIEGAMNS